MFFELMHIHCDKDQSMTFHLRLTHSALYNDCMTLAGCLVYIFRVKCVVH